MATYDPYGEEIIGLRQKQALAQKLRESAQMPQGQMVSGWYVKPSITQYLAQGLQGYMGAKEEADIEKQIKGIGEQRKAENKAWLESTPKEQTYQVEDRSALPEAQQTQMGPSPYSKALRVKPTTDETLAWAMKAPGLDTGAVAQLGVKGAELEAGRQTRLAERQMAIEAKREADIQRQQDRQDNMRFAASLRPAPQEKPLTEFQGKSVTFGTRAAEAHNILNELETNVNPLSVAASRKGGAAVNWALDPDVRKVEQAQRNFVNAVLRQESGASIGPSEFDSAIRQYFPEANDPPEVIAQKRASRELVIKGFARQAGTSGAVDIAEVYNAGAPKLPQKPNEPAASANAPAIPSQNAIAAEMARRAAAASNQGKR